MEIPAKLKVQFSRLTMEEATEIEAFFANLPNQDLEIQDLIMGNLDSLIEVLTGESPTQEVMAQS